MDTIRDRLSVGRDKRGRHFVCLWRDDLPQGEVVGFFPDHDEAWGIVSLILEYVEQHGYDPERAIAQAMIEYREALAGDAARALDNEPAWSRLGYVG